MFQARMIHKLGIYVDSYASDSSKVAQHKNLQKLVPYHGKWVMWSNGPDNIGDQGLYYFCYYIQVNSNVNESYNLPYDPTNGTISKGDLWRNQANKQQQYLN